MEFTYYTDLWSMGYALLFGVVLGLYYDMFRLLRRMFSFSVVFVAMQDLMFWFTSAVLTFFVCVRLNNGYIRIYFVLFALTGWGMYYFTAGKIIFLLIDLIIKSMSRVCEKIRRAIIAKISKKYTMKSDDR